MNILLTCCNSYWNELVWSKNQVTPIIATAKLGLYKQLKVYETVQNLVKVEQFWESEEFEQTLLKEGGGAILSLDYDYWQNIISNIISNDHDSPITEKFLGLVAYYLENQSRSQ